MIRRRSLEGLPGVLGNKVTWPISTGEQGNKGTKNVLENTGTKHSLREDKKLEKKKEKRRNRHSSCDKFFAPVLPTIFFFNLFAWNCGSG